MKNMLNTLFVTTQGAYLRKDGDTVHILIENETKLRLPIHTICGIVCFGNIRVSPYLLGMCGEHGVAVSFLTEFGRFMARVQGPVSGNVLLRREQYRRADDLCASADIARNVLIGKIVNSRVALQRSLRDHPEIDANGFVTSSVHDLELILNRLRTPVGLDALRGFEGDAARCYFRAFDARLLTDKESFFFRERSRRPPRDNVNTLLSFLYTLLVHDVASALESVGLDPAVGFLHRDRPGRPSLALDLMEPLRPFLADRIALRLINRGQVNAKGFVHEESGSVRMNDKTRKKVIEAWQSRKADEIRHPYIGEKMPIGLIPYIQATLLARFLRGDIDAYPPFIWK